MVGPRAGGWMLAHFDAGLPRAGEWRQGFALFDLNADGRLDLIHAPRPGTPHPAAFAHDGAGHWSEHAVRWPALRLLFGALRAHRVAGEQAELVLATARAGVTVLRQQAGGAFEGGWADPDAFGSRALALGDFDGDGGTDIAVLGEGPRVDLRRRVHGGRGPGGGTGLRTFLRRGAGFELARITADDVVLSGDSLAAADLDGDGRTDLFSGSHVAGHRRLAFLNRPGGWSAEALPLGPTAQVTSVAALHRAGQAALIATGTVERRDAGWHSAITVWTRSSTGTWHAAAPAWSHRGRRPVTALSWGDVNGDGEAAVVAGTADGRLLVLRRVLASDRRPKALVFRDPRVARCRIFDVAAADLDGDGVGNEIAASFGGPAQGPLGEARCESEGGLGVYRLRRAP